MADTFNKCLEEILTDEAGNRITPECGLEMLLTKMCDALTPMSDEEIDELTPM
jgi:hypothetical protein